MESIEFDWVNIDNISDNIIGAFNSGNDIFDGFIHNNAKKWNAAGESITYVFADKNEINTGSVKRIYGFASINTTGLLFGNTDSYECLSCVEIRLFAIDHRLRKRHNMEIKWSDIIFKTLLQNLYEMSTKVIGFKAIFLNANHDGYQLYIDNGFKPIDKYIVPKSDPKISIDECTPLLLTITEDVIYEIFS